jgi:hypothetical protein
MASGVQDIPAGGVFLANREDNAAGIDLSGHETAHPARSHSPILL